MRPTMEVEMRHFSRASSTTSLSLPQRGYCWRRDKTRSANAGAQVGWRTLRGRCERSSAHPDTLQSVTNHSGRAHSPQLFERAATETFAREWEKFKKQREKSKKPEKVYETG